MSDQTPDESLHLPSLVIRNFRGIDELTIPPPRQGDAAGR